MKKVYRNQVDKQIGVKLTLEQLGRVDRVLAAHGNNMSEVIRQALDYYLNSIDAVENESSRTLFNYHEHDRGVTHLKTWNNKDEDDEDIPW